MTPLLEVKNLTVSFKASKGPVEAVRGVSFSIYEGEIVGIVGESGSGKSVTAHALLRLLPMPPAIISDSAQIFYKGCDLMANLEREMEGIRGKDIGMIFQDPLTALNPSLKIGTQLLEGILKHERIGKNEARLKAIKMLGLVGIADPELRMDQYPFEFSGGMRQRISIAIALMCHPKLLIADEPTTALDVTIQSQVLDLLKGLQKEFGMSILLITHDLGVVARMCDRVIVMYQGEMVEEGTVQQVFYSPKHNYTKSLLGSISERGVHAPSKDDLATAPLLEIKNLWKEFPLTSRDAPQIVLQGIDLSILPGRTLGLVGESGCGKSTLGKTILRLVEPTAGQILFDGRDLTALKASEMREIRRKIQIIFQDPYSSLNPRLSIEQIIGEPLDIHGLVSNRKEKKERVEQLLDWVGLKSAHLSRFPHEFSGGQRQRIAIARALAVGPSLLICDEPVSALDFSIQMQIVQLFQELQQSLRLTLLFISHDLSIVRQLADEVAVMYLGNIVEKGPTEQIYQDPQHPYTKALLTAAPIPDPILERSRFRFIMEGEAPSPYSIPPGCPFHKRCPYAMPICGQVKPQLERGLSKQHQVACHFR